MALIETSATAFPTLRVAEIAPRQSDQVWLIQDLWSCEGVGIIGGAPKCAKSWLGLDMAVSVASGTPCLGRFRVCRQAPALIYLAEDALPEVRTRIENLCAHRRIDLQSLDVRLIDTSALRLDRDDDRNRLIATLHALRPALLLLDPLVRMHRLDENNSGDISSLLGFLRELQRNLHMAIVLVHHMSKRIRSQLGQALRGSGDLHAWGDHNAYLVRKADNLELSIEHRSASSPAALGLNLVTTAGTVHLETEQPRANKQGDRSNSLDDQVLYHLRESQPLRRDPLRTLLRVNNQRLGEVLLNLADRKLIIQTASGWRLAAGSE